MKASTLFTAGLPVAGALIAGSVAGLLAGAPARRRWRTRAVAAERAARTDSLTGLANRAGLEEALDALTAAGPWALTMVDLDRFKQVNDTYGHAAGDALLAGVADQLREVVAGLPGAVAARLGGDEFVLAGPSPTPAATHLLGTDALLALTTTPIEVPGAGVLVARGSLGVVHAFAGDSPARVLRAADIALYQAKTCGGDAVVMADVLDNLPLVEDRPGTRLRDLPPWLSTEVAA